MLDITLHTWATLSTTRQWRGQTANKIEFVIGEAQQGIPVVVYSAIDQGVSEYGVASFGVDTTSAEYRVYLAVAQGQFYTSNSEQISLAAGYHFLSLNQRSLTASPDYITGSLSASTMG